MKRCIIIIFILLFAANVGASNRWAVVIGISDYPRTSGWGRISGAKDIDVVIPILKRIGFEENNINILTDTQATQANIKNTLIELTEKLQEGDVVYFHFSGHGQLITDLNNDERDEFGNLTGYDTALIPYDACYKYDPLKYRGENHIIDDELNEWLRKIRVSIGKTGSLIVVLDACHSGGGTREEDDDENKLIVRGGEPFDINLSNRAGGYFGLPNAAGRGVDNTLQEDWVCISACTQNQTNYEFIIDGKSYGRLSTAIAAVLTQEMTAKQLIDAINDTQQYQEYPKPNTPQTLEYNISEELENKKIF